MFLEAPPDGTMPEDMKDVVPASAGAAADEMRVLEGEFSKDQADFKEDFGADTATRDNAMIEKEMQINIEEIEELSLSEGEGAFSVDKDELAILDREQIGIRTRDRLGKLQTPEELNRLRKMERLKSLSVTKVEGGDGLKPQVSMRSLLSPDGIRTETGLPGVALHGTTVNFPGALLPDQGFSRLESGTDQLNVRNELRPGLGTRDLVRMENSGRMVLEERKEREEFKRRQERRTLSPQSPSGASDLPYLPNGVPAIIKIP